VMATAASLRAAGLVGFMVMPSSVGSENPAAGAAP
jgi:hypothetical protein